MTFLKSTSKNIILIWAVLSALLGITTVQGQRAFNYNSQAAPTTESGIIAIANYAMQRNPAMDFLFSDVRNHDGGKVDWINAVGSPYMSEGFLPCKIYVDDEFAGDFYYRHNAYNDEIEIKDYPEDPEKLSLHTDKRFRLLSGDKELSLKNLVIEDGSYRNGYLNLISRGERFKLYTRTKVKFTEATQPVNSLVRPTPDKFTNYTDYYYSDSKKELDVAYYLKDRKRKFIQSFDKSIAGKLKDFIKEHKINVKKQEDLIKVFSFLNSLQREPAQ